ncbi:MAG: A/G-specific adenine glycosylase [Myxococcales bacterium]|nr:A/G-specific adenine glycosylase [Myxococcales bacterium]
MRRQLTAWFRANAREFPWRSEPTPYRVWVCEIMAQQTRLETVLPYFERFTTRFPDIAALAAASEDDVLALWSGLGYYSRARHLWRAARMLVDDFAGELPHDSAALQSLPGIGRYTAGAILSLAFRQSAPILDGNVSRVLARLFALETDIRSTETRHVLWRLAAELVPERNPHLFNEGLMELGALICTPTRPACGSCPLRRQCLALAQEKTEILPRRGKAAPARAVDLLVAAIFNRHGRVLLLRNESIGLFGGLWALPQIAANRRDSIRVDKQELSGFCRELLGASPAKWDRVGKAEHQLSHRRLIATVYRGRLDRMEPTLARPHRWIDPLKPPADLALAAFTRKLLRLGKE